MAIIAKTKPDVILQPTGRTRHFADGELVRGVSRLEIEDDGGGGFYLFHFNADDVNVIDTWHETVVEALRQAAFEYEIDQNAWEFVADN